MDRVLANPYQYYNKRRYTSLDWDAYNTIAAANKAAAYIPDSCSPVAALLLPVVLTAVAPPVVLPVTDPDAESFPVGLAAAPGVPVPFAPPVVAVVAAVLVSVKYNDTSVLAPNISTPPVLVPMSMVDVIVQFPTKSSNARVAVAAPQYDDDMALMYCTG